MSRHESAQTSDNPWSGWNGRHSEDKYAPVPRTDLTPFFRGSKARPDVKRDERKLR